MILTPCSYAGTDGGLADYLIVEAQNARKVPLNISLEVAALVEPLSVAWHAVTSCINTQTSSALVIGAGPIGLCIMQVLKAHHIPHIIAVDTNLARQPAAVTAGAHHFIDPSDGNLAEKCAAFCPDTGGPHVAFDTAGKQVTLDQCVGVVCVGGTVMNVAVWGGTATIVPNAFLQKEIKYMGTAVYTREDFDGVIDAVAAGKHLVLLPSNEIISTDSYFTGLMDPAFLITSRISMSEIVSHGILKLLHDPGSDLKILVDVSRP